MPLLLSNSFEAGVDGVVATPANSGGASGDAFDVVIGSPTYTTTVAANGTVALAAATSVGSYVSWTTSLASPSEVWGRVYFRISAPPASSSLILNARDQQPVNAGQLFITPAGVLQMRASATAGTPTATPFSTAVTLGQWYRVEFHLQIVAGTVQFDTNLYLGNASTVTETLSMTATGTAAATLSAYRFGSGSTTSPAVFYVDDVQVNTTGYPGPVASGGAFAAPRAASTASIAAPSVSSGSSVTSAAPRAAATATAAAPTATLGSAALLDTPTPAAAASAPAASVTLGPPPAPPAPPAPTVVTAPVVFVPPSPVGAVLGCGSYTAYVLDRGGQGFVAELPYTTLQWARTLDDTSAAQIHIDGIASVGKASCCADLAGVEPWRHEIGVYRDHQRVWAGPITSIIYSASGGDTVDVYAQDLSAWWQRRVIHQKHRRIGEDLATIFQAYAEDAMSVDNSPGLIVQTTSTGILGTRSTDPSQYRIAGNVLRELSQTGVDWTVIDRAVLAGGVEVPAQPDVVLLDESFATPPALTLDGMSQATRWYVLASGGKNTPAGIWPPTPDAALEAVYGVLEQNVVEAKIKDTKSARQAARTRWQLTHQAPASIAGDGQQGTGILDPAAGVTMSQLIPGVVVQLNLRRSCYPIRGNYRIASVDAQVQGAPPAEAVTLTFQTVGSQASDSSDQVDQ